MIVRIPCIVPAVPTPPSNLKTLQKIGQTKRFVLAVASGKSYKDAETESGISSHQIRHSPIAKQVVKELVARTFHDKKYVKKLKQLWDAEDLLVTKTGRIYSKPNYPAQQFALDRVSKLRGLDSEDMDSDQPKGITIQVVGEANVKVDRIP